MSNLPSLETFAPGIFRGRTALVTGGGTGIGFAIAMAFARLGGNVVIASRKDEHLESARRDLESAGAEVLALATNIREVEAVERLRDASEEHFGGIDYLINNAGGQFPSPPSKISDNGWRSVIDLNLNGTWNMISRFGPGLCERGYGSIVNIVHIFSFERGSAGFVHSGAARAGVVNLSYSMAQLYANKGVTVNAIAPGMVDTSGMIENEADAFAELTGQDDFLGRVRAATPMQRFGKSDEVAAAVVFLCSPAARWITGTALRVDGGEYLSNEWVPVFRKDDI